MRGTLRLVNETFASRARLAEELIVLRGHERGGTAKAAILALTFQKRSLYTAAYVSALWNELASLRLRVHGHADDAVAVAVVGDELLPPSGGADEADLAGAAAESDANEVVAVAAAGARNGDEDASGTTPAGAAAAGAAAMGAASFGARGGEPLTAVGVRLPSSGVRYGLPALQQAFEARLRTDGVAQSALPNRKHVRALAVAPVDARLEWLTAPAAAPAAAPASAPADAPEPGAGSAAELLCARVCFSLPPSAYATMALRQLLRSSSTDLEKDSSHAQLVCDQPDDEQGSSGCT